MSPAQVDLARGEEAANAFDINDQATLNLALDDALNFVTLVVLNADTLPSTLPIGTPLDRTAVLSWLSSPS